jgi:diguanylate cyclase (GGDEF)-like protein
MSKQDISSRLQNLRRRLYILIMTAGVVGYAFNIMIGLLGEASWLELVSWFVLLLVNGSFILQLQATKTIRYRSEVLVFTVTSAPLLLGFVATLFFDLYPVGEILLSNGLWFFVIYVFAFLVFSARQALFLSVFISLLSFVLVLGKLIFTPATSTLETIVTIFNYYLASFFVLTFGFTAALWREYYERMRLTAESAEHLAHTDLLTKTHNRRSLEALLERETTRADRYKRDLSMILFDLDNFKMINDTYGHAAGDDILERVASIVQANLRSDDELGRWGGEEFMVVCPETDGGQACRVAERLREAVAAGPWDTVAVTASFGTAHKYGGELLGSLYERADKALYEAKRAGKNCVKAARANDAVTTDGVFVSLRKV